MHTFGSPFNHDYDGQTLLKPTRADRYLVTGDGASRRSSSLFSMANDRNGVFCCAWTKDRNTNPKL